MSDFFPALGTVAGQVATLFIMMAVGYCLKKLKKITVEMQKQIMFILLYIVSPCLIVNAMQIERSMDAAKSMLITAGGCVLYFVICVALNGFFFKKREPDTRDVLRFSTIYPNCAFMGFPLIRAVLGDGSMVYASVFLIIFQLIHWTHGVVLMGGRKAASIKAVLVNPGTFGFVFGILLFALNVKMPWPIGNACRMVSEINTPLAMFVIGAQMADADLLKLFKMKNLYAAGALKLIVFPAIAAAILYPLNLSPIVYCTVVILAATPSAGVTAMFAQQFERDEITGASAVSLTTLLSIVTLPVFAAAAKLISGI